MFKITHESSKKYAMFYFETKYTLLPRDFFDKPSILQMILKFFLSADHQ